MREIIFNEIKSLVYRTKVIENSLQCVFFCPDSNEKHLVVVPLTKNGSMPENPTERNILNKVQGQISKLLNTNITSMESTGSQEKNYGDIQLSNQEIEEAIVRAFEKVARHFKFDEKTGGWICAADNEDTSFEKQLLNSPVIKKYDRDILSRMLVSIATADGKIVAREKKFLNEFLENETIKEMSILPRLTDEEFDDVSEGNVRDSMLMIAYAIALTDEDLDQLESYSLGRFSKGLGISDEKSMLLKKKAQFYIMENIIDELISGTKFAKNSKSMVDFMALDILKAVAGKIGLDAEAAEKCLKAYKDKNGI